MAATVLETQKKKTRLMTEGSIWKNILLFSVPLILGNLLQQLYNTADSIIVGNFVGSNALAAVGSSGSPIFLLIGFSQGIAVGAGVVVSQFLGAKDREGAHTAVHTSLALSAILGAILTVCGIAVSRALLTAMNTPAEVLEDAVLYMRLYFGGVLFSVVYNMAAGILNAAGNSKRSLLYLGVASITNIVLDLVLIAGCKMGVAGAAIATVSAQLISTLGCFAYAFSKYPELRLHQEDWQITRHDVTRHLIQGIPLGLQFSVLAIGIIVVQSIVVQFDMLNGVMVSNSAQNGFGAANKINSLLMTPLNGLGSAMTRFTAQNLGAGDTKRIKKGTLQSLIIMLIMAACSILIGLLLTINGTYLHIFLSADKVTAETLRFGNSYLYIDLSLYAFLGFIFVARNCVQGIGKPQFVLGAGAAELVARVAVCLLLPAALAGGVVSAQAPQAAVYGLCVADPFAWIAADAVLCIPFIKNIMRENYDYLYGSGQKLIER